MDLGLRDRVAIVTGASRGIGRAIALALADAGADVAVNYRSRDREAGEVASEVRRRGRRCVVARADVAVGGEVARMVAAVEQGLGAVAILVNNAGIARPLAVDGIAESDWDETIAVNLKSAFLVTQAVLPGMRARQWGRIINVSSVAAQVGGIVGPHYAASKAGLVGLTHSYASLLAQEGITVNAIAPALIEDTGLLPGDPGELAKRVPVGRLGRPEEVADLALAMLANGYLTNQVVLLDGGMHPR